MDNDDRKKIRANLSALVEGTNDFNRVFDCLTKEKMFNDYMVKEILSQDAQNRLEYMYEYVTTRGPKAFRLLCKVLNETDNGSLAALLSSTSAGGRMILNGYGSNMRDLVEEFPDDIEEWQVSVDLDNKFDLNRGQVYKMESKPKGLALIINNHNFVNDVLDPRHGSDKDIARLKTLLRQLDYKIILWEDLPADKIKEKVREFAKMEEHYDCDSCMVFIMSHGDQEKEDTISHQTVDVMGTDARAVNSRQIVDELVARRCQGLAGKPKILFFQTCRGDNHNYPAPRNSPSPRNTRAPRNILSLPASTDQSGTPPTTPDTDGKRLNSAETWRGNMDDEADSMETRNDADFLIAYSTSPGNVAYRHPDTGSWYIQSLCRVFSKYSCNTDIETMLKYVRREYKRLEYQDTPKKTSLGFHKKFYFQPGIYDPNLRPTNGF